MKTLTHVKEICLDWFPGKAPESSVYFWGQNRQLPRKAQAAALPSSGIQW